MSISSPLHQAHIQPMSNTSSGNGSSVPVAGSPASAGRKRAFFDAHPASSTTALVASTNAPTSQPSSQSLGSSPPTHATASLQLDSSASPPEPRMDLTAQDLGTSASTLQNGVAVGTAGSTQQEVSSSNTSEATQTTADESESRYKRAKTSPPHEPERRRSIGVQAEPLLDDPIPMQMQGLHHSPQAHPRSILASMNSPPMAPMRHSPGGPTGRSGSAFPYALPPVSGIRSPRRAMICASLEAIAEASSQLTHTAIHPAILHSLSIRLQAMNHEEAEIVLARLQQLAEHIARQNEKNKQMQARASHRSPASTSTVQTGTSPHRGSGIAGHSPMPLADASVASIESRGTSSNATSPTISPSVRPATGPSSPALAHLQAKLHATTTTHMPSMLHSREALHATHHPPLHPPLPPHAHPYTHMLPSSSLTAGRPLTSVPHPSFPSSLPRVPSNGTLATTASPSGAHVPGSAATTAPLMRGVSDDSQHIPTGLLMLIEALPGTQPLQQYQPNVLPTTPVGNGTSQASTTLPATNAPRPTADLLPAAGAEHADATTAGSEEAAASTTGPTLLQSPQRLTRSTSH